MSAVDGGAAEHVDVLVVGAGLSGVGAAAVLRRRLPHLRLAVLEARGALGGTWDLFRYPGVRSDSDMFTLGYAFRPWSGTRAIAEGGEIRDYIVATARAEGVEPLVRLHHRVLRAAWDSATARWSVTVERPARDGGGGVVTEVLTCSFLHCCTGYYRYDGGHSPQLPGAGAFTGRVVHPQHWPADLDTTGQRVVVLGSGATAVTLLPALAPTAEHVTMLQRSPSWLLSLHRRDPLARRLAGRVPARAAYEAVRWKNIAAAQVLYQLSRRRPALVRRRLLAGVARQLPPGTPLAPDFVPRYDPWDQRLCFTPGGDLFRALRGGRASVVTGTVATLTARGVRLDDGRELPADVLVTATGLRMLALGGMDLVVDGRPVDVPAAVAYKGMMLSGVPNFAMALGYTNASWTLKVDLVNGYVARLLRHLADRGLDAVTPLAPPTTERSPLIDLQAGYVRRGASVMPQQGPRAPWRLHQSYARDLLALRHGRLDDEGVAFTRAGQPVPAA